MVNEGKSLTHAALYEIVAFLIRAKSNWFSEAFFSMIFVVKMVVLYILGHLQWSSGPHQLPISSLSVVVMYALVLRTSSCRRLFSLSL